MVLKGYVDDVLLDSYYEECKYGVEENIFNLSRIVDFLMLWNIVYVFFWDVVLDFVEDFEFVCLLVNFGWFLNLCIYDGFLLNSLDVLLNGVVCMWLGSFLFDVFLKEGFLLDRMFLGCFLILGINCDLLESMVIGVYMIFCLLLKVDGDFLVECFLG